MIEIPIRSITLYICSFAYDLLNYTVSGRPNCRRCLIVVSFPIFSGCYASFLFKNSGKMAIIAEAGIVDDLRNRKISLFQKLFRMENSFFSDIFRNSTPQIIRRNRIESGPRNAERQADIVY